MSEKYAHFYIQKLLDETPLSFLTTTVIRTILTFAPHDRVDNVLKRRLLIGMGEKNCVVYYRIFYTTQFTFLSVLFNMSIICIMIKILVIIMLI